MSICVEVPSFLGAFSRPIRHGALMKTGLPSWTSVRDHWLTCVAPFLYGRFTTVVFQSLPSARTVTSWVPGGSAEMSMATSSNTGSSSPWAWIMSSQTRNSALDSFM